MLQPWTRICSSTCARPPAPQPGRRLRAALLPSVTSPPTSRTAAPNYAAAAAPAAADAADAIAVRPFLHQPPHTRREFRRVGNRLAWHPRPRLEHIEPDRQICRLDQSALHLHK